MLVLLTTCSDFSRKTFGEGGREGLEAVEDADDTLLLGERRDRDAYIQYVIFSQICLINAIIKSKKLPVSI